MNPILALSGTRQAELIRDGAITSLELIELHLDRIAAVNPALNAAIDILAVSARREAEAADRRRANGIPPRPLEGVPFSIKDSIEVAGTICTAGTLGFRLNAPSEQDATLVARLRAAGAIPLARTNLPDLLFSFETDNLIYGRANNPYNPERTPGGSSGGEAALIAACGSPFGLGSDAFGSVRVPAHCCGIASIKPTSGRLSRAGHVPGAGGWGETVWQIGPMARRVEDLITMMPLLLGAPGSDDERDRTLVPMPYSAPGPIGKLRIAYFTDNGLATPDADTIATVRAAAAALEPQVALIEERRPPSIERAYDLEMKFFAPDGADGMRAYLKAIGSERRHPLLDAWLAKHEAFRTDLAGFGNCWSELDAFRDAMHGFMRDYDAILSPAASLPAVPHGTSVDEATFLGFSYTMAHNLTGWPAAVVRAGTSRDGLPIGVQIAARPWREDVALAIAQALEQEFPLPAV